MDRNTAADIAIAGASRGDRNAVTVGETKQGRNGCRITRKRHGIRFVGRKPFVSRMLREDFRLEAEFAWSQNTLQLCAHSACQGEVQIFNAKTQRNAEA